MSNEKNPGNLLYIGDNTTQLYGDYFINHYKLIPIKEPVIIMESRGPGRVFWAVALPMVPWLRLDVPGS